MTRTASAPLLALLLALTLALGGCASEPKQEPEPVTEHQSLDRSARLAFTQGQYAQAATLYEAVLEHALAEDAAQAIIDARFNLALAQTYLGNYASALAQVTLADAERLRRDLGPDPDLQLLQATIRYRAGETARAANELEVLLTNASLPAATRSKAHFVAGLIAADRKDAATLHAHVSALYTDTSPAAEADRLELRGRLAAIEQRHQEALRLLDEAVVMRSLERDYRGMVRTLAAAGDLAEQTQQYGAAGNYLLRAGRSAAQRAEPEAVAWLTRARDLGQRSGDSALVLEAEGVLNTLRDKQ